MLSNLPKEIRIVEVGPRDGLQNEKQLLSTEDKSTYIKLLVEAGLKTIEATSFVRPDKVPQMGDAQELLTSLKSLEGQVALPCLVPNEKGLELAIKAGVKEIAVFTATSESFNKKNINASVDDSLANIKTMMAKAQEHQLKIRSYVSTAFGCPYEGLSKNTEQLIKMTEQLHQWGSYDISIGDTIGIASPTQVSDYLSKVKDSCPLDKLSMHFHDTRGRALSNILTSLELGVTSFDSSSGGLGGCPFAQGATGNVATEDVVGLMESMGIQTGIDMEKLAKASQFILGKLQRQTTSKFLQSYLSQGK